MDRPPKIDIPIDPLSTVSDALEQEAPVIVHCLSCHRTRQMDPFHIARVMGPLPFGVVIGKMRCNHCKQNLSVVLPWYTPTLKEWVERYQVPPVMIGASEGSLLFRLDIWAERGGCIERTLGWIDDLDVGKAALNAAAEKWPDKDITIRRGALVVGRHPETQRKVAKDEAA